ncbi:hypothetical protein [Myceligenerans indicum]|uniref:Uncharacterized protein n=1 Tax=Myceligenerans indicum TaxID=2593663 RepID=A0ABS1LK64_9MICO|nr:hypothetical protein [Myceligenerans indicum]MBL0886601.1 hypothetical protein [Myceligenerans indicum]
MHVLVITRDIDDARQLSEAWSRAVPGVGAEPRAVRVAPSAPASPSPPSSGSAVPEGDGGPDGARGAPQEAGRNPGSGPAPVVVAGTRLTVGAPPPEPAGPSAPRSVLPPAEAAALSGAAATCDVVVAWVPVLDAGTLRAGPLAEAAAAAAPHAVPVVALAERVEVSRRELASAGVSGAHEVHGTDVGRVARSWTPGWA